jgi:hypothetical protein
MTSMGDSSCTYDLRTRRLHGRGVRAILRAFALGVAVSSAGCAVEAGPVYPGYGDDYPPDTFIATTDPVYFEGHAAYWYGNRWFYRDGGRWNHYDREPAGLAQRRGQGSPARYSYGSSGRATVHSGGGGARGGGGHGGGHR